jgi:hypothetical protein
MKALRSFVFLMAVGVFPAFLMQAYAQQEVDPDHYEQASAKAVSVSANHAKHSGSSSHKNYSHSKHMSASSHHHHSAHRSA